MSSWQPRTNAYNDPVCIIGAGVLGRRLATMWASRGGTVHIVDTIQSVREDALRYFEETEKPVQVRKIRLNWHDCATKIITHVHLQM